QAKWSDTETGPTNGIKVVFDRPSAEARTVYLRFDPTPPRWVLVVTGLSAMAVLALALFGKSRNEEIKA
ncbi:MAG: hypothetical protein ACKO39_11470, partial [Chthoniobacterales bacterium]